MDKNIKVVAGIDVGGTHTRVGLADSLGNIYGERTLSTRGYAEFDNLIGEIGGAIAQMCMENTAMELLGIGIGAPAANRHSGCIESAADLPWKGKLCLVDKLAKFYRDIPIILTNDANAAATGEMIYGGARGMKDFLVVTLGTGVGSGFVAGGEVIYGHDGMAGELGHVIVEKGGRQCGCGRRGCLETYTSATGICRTLLELMADTMIPSPLRDKKVSGIGSRDIAIAAQQGDELALKTFDITGEYLGLALANAVAVTGPEAIFLFGGLAQAGDLILRPTARAMDENLLGFWKGRIYLRLSELHDMNVAVLGAAALAWNAVDRK